ncbi:MAG: HAD family hydrolase [bacterium]
MTGKAAVFIDRDGTLNEDMGYVNHVSRFHIFPRSIEAIRLLNRAGVLAVLVSNQSGVAMGYFPDERVREIHDHMNRELASAGVRLDGVYYCPHHPRAAVEEYRMECRCRKPATGMADRAVRELGIAVERACVVGDKPSDFRLAHRLGVPGVLVMTGYGRGEWEYNRHGWERRPDHVCEDLLDAVRWFLDTSEKRP